jgi:flavin-dependent dehydrogenase
LFEKPVVISQISFEKKQTYNHGIIMLGDAAGAIAPLCGNGMSIAMRASKFLANHVHLFLNNKISKDELIKNYRKEWNRNFATRIKIAYYLQHLFGKRLTTLMSLKFLNHFPTLFKQIISLTHGKKF